MQNAEVVAKAAVFLLRHSTFFLLPSHESRQIKSRCGLAHFGVGNFLGLRERLIGGGENHVLDDLRVSRIQRLRINFDGNQRAVAFGGDAHRTATAGGCHRARRELRLNLFHLLLHFRSLFHEFGNVGHIIKLVANVCVGEKSGADFDNRAFENFQRFLDERIVFELVFIERHRHGFFLGAGGRGLFHW